MVESISETGEPKVWFCYSSSHSDHDSSDWQRTCSYIQA